MQEMELRKQIHQDLNQAIKQKEEVVSSVLRLLNSAILNKEKEKRYKLSKEKPDLTEEKMAEESRLTKEEIIDVISSEVKKRRESVVEYEKAGRKDLAEKEKKEIEILQKYLPEQMSEEEIRKLVKEAIEKTGAAGPKDMGKIMGVLIPQVKGRADGSLVSKIVKESLSSKEQNG